MLQAPYNEIKEYLDVKKYIDREIDFEILEKLGCFHLKNAIPKKVIDEFYNLYKNYLTSGLIKKDHYHLTMVEIDNVEKMQRIINNSNFIDVASKFFDCRVGADFIRIVKKDSENFSKVFLHQDTGYQIGGFECYSLFIALTECDEHNGGLTLLPGTHNFGYLGDVGEINEALLPSDYPRITPNAEPGDILIMHSSIWHESAQSKNLKERVYLEVHIQPIDEPTTRWEISGKRSSGWILNASAEQIFKDSRTQRIRRLAAELKNIQSE
jgi:hypothetical protein